MLFVHEHPGEGMTWILETFLAIHILGVLNNLGFGGFCITRKIVFWASTHVIPPSLQAADVGLQFAERSGGPSFWGSFTRNPQAEGFWVSPNSKP